MKCFSRAATTGRRASSAASIRSLGSTLSMTAGATSSKSSLIGSSTAGSVPSPLWMGRRHFGGGKMTGGVRKTSDIAASIALYEGWTLQPGTRDALKKKFPEMHLLVWQYVASLHKMYHSLLTLQERPEASGRMEDFLRAEVKNVLTKSSFSFVRWQQIYQNEVDDTTEVAKILNAIDVTVGERAALAPSSDMTADQVAEMKSMFDEELADSLEKLATRHLQDLQAVIHRRVAAFDVLGSSSRTWIVEVVGKAGGEEASIFASELLEFLKNYAKNVHEWNVEAVEEENAAGASIPNACKLRFTGDGVYRHLRHEIGVHKVQRVPVTDADGKMQTSTAVVTMMPVLDPIAVNVREEDCRFEFVRGSGPGGQGMQSSSNCCVLLHKPTGIHVKCHQSRSALGNKEIALQMVAQQILAAKVKESQNEQDAAWANQWFSGERSEKMRTYNFPQNRVTDHRLGRDFPLATFLDGTGKLFLELHDSMNAVDDLVSTDATLRRHLEGKFGSDTVQ